MADIFQHSIKINNKYSTTILNKKSIKFNNAQDLAQWLYLNKHTTNTTGYLVSKEVETSIDFDTIYPVNSVYLTYDKDINPNAFMPKGNWQRIGGGRALWNGNPNTFTEEQRYLDAGLPNITGSFQMRPFNVDSYPIRENTGAFTSITHDGIQLTTTFSSKSNTQKLYKHYFDASGSSDIYGNSTTVQPPAVTVFAWLRVS